MEPTPSATRLSHAANLPPEEDTRQQCECRGTARGYREVFAIANTPLMAVGGTPTALAGVVR